jgi:DNA-binding MarR family transcriptional regulator
LFCISCPAHRHPEIRAGAGSDYDATALLLTDVGKAEREVIFKRHSEVRRRALQGITDQEYMTVIDVLQRMVNNLE